MNHDDWVQYQPKDVQEQELKPMREGGGFGRQGLEVALRDCSSTTYVRGPEVGAPNAIKHLLYKNIFMYQRADVTQQRDLAFFP